MGGRAIPPDDYDYDQAYYEDFLAAEEEAAKLRRERALARVDVAHLTGNHATVAVAKYDDITVHGDAKRNKGERKNPDVGRELAVGRALRLLGDELVARAYQTLDCEESK